MSATSELFSSTRAKHGLLVGTPPAEETEVEFWHRNREFQSHVFIDNDAQLYQSQAKPIMENLARKMIKGTYNHTLAVKAWQYLADAGAKK